MLHIASGLGLVLLMLPADYRAIQMVPSRAAALTSCCGSTVLMRFQLMRLVGGLKVNGMQPLWGVLTSAHSRTQLWRHKIPCVMVCCILSLD
jgi:hypothetical protein